MLTLSDSVREAIVQKIPTFMKYFHKTMTPPPPYSFQMSAKVDLLEQGKIVQVTPVETSDRIDEYLATSTLTPTDISTAEDSGFAP